MRASVACAFLGLAGISDWLEHFKHQLACGSVNIFIGAPRVTETCKLQKRVSITISIVIGAPRVTEACKLQKRVSITINIVIGELRATETCEFTETFHRNIFPDCGRW